MRKKFIFTLLIASLLVGCDVADYTVAETHTQENISIVAETTTSDETDVVDDDLHPLVPYVERNNNTPYFTDDEITDISFESYSELDELGRCGVAFACLSTDTQPPKGEKRGEIGSVKPSGWHTVKYPEVISDLYLYNRCHLIGWQLGNENANKLNLITGTRYLNIEGMLPFENLVDDYIERTGNHVMYRVTPLYTGNNLVADGVLMEGLSVEDNEIEFCVWCPNVQPGVVIDYATGDSWLLADTTHTTKQEETEIVEETNSKFILNTNTKKIHTTTCSSATKTSESNKEETTETLDELIEKGYEPCKICNPQ